MIRNFGVNDDVYIELNTRDRWFAIVDVDNDMYDEYANVTLFLDDLDALISALEQVKKIDD